MPHDQELIMRLDSVTTAILKQLELNAAPYVDVHGTILVRLRRALYGCVQSSKLWYDKLCAVLLEYGFIRNNYDSCVFNLIDEASKKQLTVCFHVDDLLITCESKDAISRFEIYLKRIFSEVTFVNGFIHKYLSMNLTKEGGY
jgi:hypothetical protein